MPSFIMSCGRHILCCELYLQKKMRKGLGKYRLEEVTGEFATVTGLGMLGSVDNVETGRRKD